MQNHNKNSNSVDTGIELTPRQKKMRRARNIAISVILAACAILIYAVTVAKLGVNVLKRPM